MSGPSATIRTVSRIRHMAKLGIHPNWIRRHPFWTGVVAVAAIAITWLVLRNDNSDLESPLVTTIARGTIEDVVSAAGELKPFRVVSVGAQVSGQLQALHVKVGDFVQEGTLIAEIDSEIQEKEVEASLANLRGLETQLPASQAALEFAEASLRRQSRLMEENATAEAQYDQAVSALASARAQILQLGSNIEQSRVRIEAQQTRLRYSRIHAPITGTVSLVQVEVGQTLNATQQTPVILDISDTSSMQVRSYVSEADVRRLTEGMPVYFTTLGDARKEWHSELRQLLLSPQNRGGVIFYPALFEIDNPGGLLFPDMTAEVFFVINKIENVPVVPLAALTIPSDRAPPSAAAVVIQRTRPELAFRPKENTSEPEGEGTLAIVYVVDEAGEISRREIRIGTRDLINAQVISGLREGEDVVLGERSESSSGQVRFSARVR